jgi:hypothetical protein
MVPRTLPATTAWAMLLYIKQMLPDALYMTESSSSFAFKARRDEDILALCCSDYFP